MTDLTEEEINEARALNQQYQLILAQKQALTSKNAELENTLKELETAEGKVFYGTGSVLIESDKKTVKDRLEKQKKQITDSLESFETREKSVRKKIKKFQEKLQQEESD